MGRGSKYGEVEVTSVLEHGEPVVASKQEEIWLGRISAANVGSVENRVALRRQACTLSQWEGNKSSAA